MGTTGQERREKLAEKSTETVINLFAVWVCADSATLSVKNSQDVEAMKTAIWARIGEDSEFQGAFADAAVRIIKEQMAINRCKPFQWSERERLEAKRMKFINSFGRYVKTQIEEWVSQ